MVILQIKYKVKLVFETTVFSLLLFLVGFWLLKVHLKVHTQDCFRVTNFMETWKDFISV